MNATMDHHPDLTAAYALFALLEASCLAATAAETLPYVGMARSELFEHCVDLPADFSQLQVGFLDDGLEQLDGLLRR